MTAFEQEDLQFIDFPDDDRLWWVRWADGYSFPYPGTDTAGIYVFLSTLPFEEVAQITPADIPSIIVKPAKKAFDKSAPGEDSRPQTNIRVGILVGSIPALRIGDIYRRGKFVGRLPFPERSFQVDTVKSSPSCIKVGDRVNPPPPGWKSDHPYRLINPYDYQLSGLYQSRCFVIETDRETVLIPCQEIFRTLFAPHTQLANAFTQQHWEEELQSFVDMQETRVIPPNIWQVATRRRLAESAVMVLTYLILDEHARRAARRITSRFFHLRESWIEASFPFPPGMIQFKAQYVQIQNLGGKPRVLVTCISEIKWPYCVDIQRLEDAESEGDGENVQLLQPTHHVTRQLPARELDPKREKIENVTPNTTLKTCSAFSRGFAWKNPPAIKTIRRPSRKLPVDVQFVGPPPVDQPTSSTGVPKGARTTSGGLEFEVKKERSIIDRFRDFKKILDDLQDNGFIDDWNLVPSAVEPVQLQGFDVWAIPNKTNGESNTWCSISHSKYHRVALIFRIVRYPVTAFLLELETRHSEGGFRFVLFEPHTGREDSCIAELLQVAANVEGVWPAPLVGNKKYPLQHLKRAITRRHTYVKDEATTSDGKERAMNGKTIKRTVTDFIGRNS